MQNDKSVTKNALFLLGLLALPRAANSSTAGVAGPDRSSPGTEIAVQKLGAEPRLDAAKAGDETASQWLRNGSPWDLRELPLLGARYGERTLVVIVPWSHYAELVFGERIGVRFSFPEGRNNTTPCAVVAQWAGPALLEVARAFREWRRNAPDLGAIPRPRSLARKAADLPQTAQLFGAPHFYLWGPAMFSRHDVERRKWIPLARALRDGTKGSLPGYVVGPYDSYHSVHSPDAHPDQTWETAQFDAKAYREGRIVKAKGERQGGFKGRGFHLSPTAAWPYVQKGVGSVLTNHACSAWFVDCDATVEWFDAFNPLHPARKPHPAR